MVATNHRYESPRPRAASMDVTTTTTTNNTSAGVGGSSSSSSQARRYRTAHSFDGLFQIPPMIRPPSSGKGYRVPRR